MSFNEWKEYRLGDVITFQRGSDLTINKIIAGKYPVVGSSGIIGYHHKKTTLGPGVTIGRSGNSVGKPFFVNEDFWAHNTTLYVKEFLKVSPKYFFYLLHVLNLKSFDGGSAVPTLNRNHLYEQRVLIPDLKVQSLIASILSSLDEKIELNRQTNQTLETIAQTFFKEMCLPNTDTDELPKGWKIEALDNIADFLNGLALQKFPAFNDKDYLPAIKIRELKNGITDSSDKVGRNVPEKYIIKNGDLLFSWSATLEVMFWCYGEGALNQHLFKVTSEKFPLWFCYMLINHHLDGFRRIASDKTTTIGHIQRKHLTEALCFVPNNLDEIDKIISPFIEQIQNNNYETQTLTSIRDSLLPKLMNGEIKLNLN